MKNKIFNVFNTIKIFATSHKILSIIIGIVVIITGYYSLSKIFASAATVQYTFGKVTRGNLVVSVSGSGQVSTLSKVSIKPNTTGQTQTLGQITSVRVKNGDTVKAGDIVAILDGKNALQTLTQAKASVVSAQANYNKVAKGMTDAEAMSANNAVTSAQTSLDNARQNILIKIRSAYTTASNAVYINTDSIFSDVMSSNPTLSIGEVTFNSQQLQNNVNQGRSAIGPILTSWREEVRNLSLTDDLITSMNDSISDLNIMRNYFDDMTMLFAVYSVSSNSSGASSINTYKSAAASARSSIDSLMSDFTSTVQSYNNLVFSLQNAKDSLVLKQKPVSEDDLAVAQASLDNANANLANAQTAYASRIIVAPFDGQIGGLSAEVGQQVSSSDSLGTLITSEKVINVTLNEVDAAKISAGNPVTITFDSLPGVTLDGNVSYIDPLGTVTQGVVSYSVQIKMNEQNEQVKTAMTASVAITTTQHTDTLIIPTSAITTTGGKKYVLVADVASSSMKIPVNNFTGASSTRDFSSTTGRDFASSTKASSTRQFGSSSKSYATNTTQFPVTSVEVITGISNNTMTEIIGGLSEGQLIVTKKTTVGSGTTAKTSASTATTNTRTGGFGEGSFGGGAVGGVMIRN